MKKGVVIVIVLVAVALLAFFLFGGTGNGAAPEGEAASGPADLPEEVRETQQEAMEEGAMPSEDEIQQMIDKQMRESGAK